MPLEVVFFTGNKTPLKRYLSYFPTLELIEQKDDKLDPYKNYNIILCHSLGFKRAIDFCIKYNLHTNIVSMDGTCDDIPYESLLEYGINVYMFCPVTKFTKEKEQYFKHCFYYDFITFSKTNHHPYMNKSIRDKIIDRIEQLSII